MPSTTGPRSVLRSDVPLKTLIVGSYRRHFKEILAIKSSLEAHGIEVLAPASEQIVNPGETFALLESDENRTPRQVQDRIFSLIRSSDFIVVANVDGYLGHATTLEIGYAIAAGTDVTTVEAVEDPNIAGYTQPLDLDTLADRVRTQQGWRV